MKVLWFVQENFDPSREKGGYNGAGWISSLRNEIVKKRESIWLWLSSPMKANRERRMA